MRTGPNGCEARVSYEDLLVDTGKKYFISHAALGSAAAFHLHFKVGARPLRIALAAAAGLACRIAVKEGVSSTANGTGVPFRNRNRLFKDDDLLAKAYTGSTYTGGTQIRTNQAGFGTNPGTAASGGSDGSHDYVFKPNTEYAVEFTPTASTDVIVLASAHEED